MGNIGQKTEEIAEKIDWIAYSQKANFSWGFPPFIEDNWKPIHPLPNYTHGEENKQGVRRFWNTVRTSQGKYVILSGSAMTNIAEHQQQFMEFLASGDGKPTRIDYCVDVIGKSLFNPKACVAYLRKREVKTHAQQIPKYVDEWKGGFSQYIGKKGSETYTRIYDKKAEQGADFQWSRVETVYQGERAEASLHAYLLHKSTVPLIKAHVDFPNWKQWNRVMSGGRAKLLINRKQSNTREWLLGTVSSSIAKEMLLDDDQSFLFDMINRVREEYKRLSGDDDIDW